MIKNYLRIAARNLAKNRSFTIIHILGLSIGAATFLLILQYVVFEKSYDRFHERADHIYRVPIEYSEGFGNFPKTAANHPALGPALKRDFPEVESFTRIMHPSNIGSSVSFSRIGGDGQKIFFTEDQTYAADSSFLRIFSFKPVLGDIHTALSKPNSVVLCASLVDKYFGESDPIGEVLQCNGSDVVVTAVIEDVPKNSHLQFNALLSFTTVFSSSFADNSWVWPEFYTYVVLRPDADVKALERKLPALTERYMAEVHKEHNFQTYFSFQPLLDIHLKSDCHNEPSPPGDERIVYFLTLLGIFILIIAGVNYVNLSTSKSIERAMEVGVRKVMGATKSQLMSQFFLESMMICSISICVGFIIARSFLPIFTELVGKDIGASLMNVDMLTRPEFWLVFVGAILVGGLLAGLYPALVLAGYRPIHVLKGQSEKVSGGISFRRVLVCLQFILSLLLLSATILVTRQLNFMGNKELGYAKDKILVIKAPVISDSLSSAKEQVLLAELRSLPQVNSMTKSSDVPGKMVALRSETRKYGLNKELNTSIFLLRADDQFLTTYDIPLIAGRDFISTDSSLIYGARNNRVLINEVLSETYGFHDPEEAIGQNISFKLGQPEHPATIVGVVKNHHQRSVKESYDPIMYYFPSWSNWRYYSLNVTTAKWVETIQRIEDKYREVFSGHTLDYFFLDEFFDRQYRSEKQFGKVSKLMALLAIFIACLGFFGLSSLTLVRRAKEMGVRKILGATLSDIVSLLTRDFVSILVLANLIALPIILYYGGSWLDNFAFNAGMGWPVFLLPFGILMLMIMVIIGLQLYKSSLLNPINSLRDE